MHLGGVIREANHRTQPPLRDVALPGNGRQASDVFLDFRSEAGQTDHSGHQDGIDAELLRQGRLGQTRLLFEPVPEHVSLREHPLNSRRRGLFGRLIPYRLMGLEGCIVDDFLASVASPYRQAL